MNTAIAPIFRRETAPLETQQATTDGDLLRAFVAERDELVFAEIVARHGGMVLGVCRRVAGDRHDAEDAFQATFLVLAAKAAKVRPPEMLGAWLYGVAYRTAQKARCNAARRRDGERRAAAMNTTQTTLDQHWDELRPVLDEEVNRLPARYRAAIVACDLEGKGRQDAAEELRVNPGTLSSRLARGRELLAARLMRRGVALSAGALAGLLASNAATAAPAAGLVSATVSAGVAMSATGGMLAAGTVSAKAAVLSEGVMRAMFMSKAKIVVGLVIAAALGGTGIGMVTRIALGADKPKVAKNDAAPAKGDKKGDFVKPDLSGPVVDVSADGKQVTLQTAKATKNDVGATTVIKLPDASKVTYSAITAAGDKPVEGYDAQVWLEAGSTDRAKRVAFMGRENFKSINRSADAQGLVTNVSPDGKQFSVETPSKEKGVDPQAMTVNITPATDLRFAAITTGGARMQEGQSAQVWFDPAARENAGIVRLTGQAPGTKKGDGEKNADVSGPVVAVSADGKTISLEGKATAKGEDPPRTEVKLADSTQVIYNGVGQDGAQPTAGYAAQAWVENGVAKRVVFNAYPKEPGPDISSRVVNVSADGRVITVETPSKVKGEGAGQKEIVIEGAKVVYMGVHAGEAKPTEGYEARIWLEKDAPGAAARVMFTQRGEGKEGK